MFKQIRECFSKVWATDTILSIIFYSVIFSLLFKFARSNNHRCNSWTQISTVAWQTVHKHRVADEFHYSMFINSSLCQCTCLCSNITPVVAAMCKQQQLRSLAFSYIFLLESRQAVEWRLGRNYFSGTCCLWTTASATCLLLYTL